LIVMTIAIVLNFVPFCMSHIMIAEHYNRLATEVPAILAGREDTLKPRNYARYHFLLACNVIAPMLQAASAYGIRSVTLHGKQPEKWLSLFTTISFEATGAVQVISGIILVKGVWKIKTFFKENNAEDFLDISTLWRHALTFGIFLVSCVLFYVMFGLFSFFPFNKQIYVAFDIVKTFYVIASGVS